jgi:lipopolysaccharide transport system permease protein
VRDITQVTAMLTTMLLFLSPIFFPASAMPAELKIWMTLNPLVYFLDEARNTLIYGVVPDLSNWVVATCISAFVAWLGFAWFQKSRRAFADVL